MLSSLQKVHKFILLSTEIVLDLTKLIFFFCVLECLFFFLFFFLFVCLFCLFLFIWGVVCCFIIYSYSICLFSIATYYSLFLSGYDYSEYDHSVKICDSNNTNLKQENRLLSALLTSFRSSGLSANHHLFKLKNCLHH